LRVRIRETENAKSQQKHRSQQRQAELSRLYLCRKCGESYTSQERNQTRFCKKCGTWLTAISNSHQTSSRFMQNAEKSSQIDLSSCKTRFLPEKYKSRIAEAHQRGAHILRNAGFIPEPLETAFLVEEHRWFWKPEEVKFILVAESHVYTSAEESRVKIVRQRLPKNFPKNAPLNFVKLVYCLGYGEPDILDFPEKIANNPGTKDYIDLFRKCINFKSQCLKKLEWKSELLNATKEKGIWLLDASLHACALGKRQRLPSRIVKKILPISWNRYVKPVLDDTKIDQDFVWIVGKGVHETLEGKYIRGSNWVYQPNARFNNETFYEVKRKREFELQRAIRRRCKI